MFVMISPLQAHLGETLTSLKFATKVGFFKVTLFQKRFADAAHFRFTILILERRGSRQRLGTLDQNLQRNDLNDSSYMTHDLQDLMYSAALSQVYQIEARDALNVQF